MKCAVVCLPAATLNFVVVQTNWFCEVKLKIREKMESLAFYFELRNKESVFLYNFIFMIRRGMGQNIMVYNENMLMKNKD